MAIDTVFWDFGGVIVEDNVKTAFKQYGVPYDEFAREAWRRHRLGKTTQGQFFKEAMHPHIYGLFGALVQRKADELIRIKDDGALPVVKALYGKICQGVISNHSREWGKYIVGNWQLDSLLNPIIVSAEVGMDKDSEDIFRYALDKAATTPERALFIDDKLENVNLARSVGMKGIHYMSREQVVKDLREYGIRVPGLPHDNA